jgi:DNA-binding SARP family transcriptional activator/TolB-like protein
MLFLRTFGGAAIVADDGVPLDGTATQRRLLALLATLAVAGDAGLTRDRLVGLLRPEGDPTRVRHALTQALYHARRSLGCDDLFGVGADIRLNPTRIASDVDQFRNHVAAGELTAAVDLYGGPFLDGFFVSGSPEFDQWVSATRDRFAKKTIVALDKLATLEEERSAWLASAVWRRRIVDIDPLSAAATTNLMTALANGGDRALAIHHAQLYSVLVREQLDLEPDESVELLVARLRRSSPARALPAVAIESVPPAAIALTGIDEPSRLASVVRGRRPSFDRWITAAGLVATVAVVGMLVTTALPQMAADLSSSEAASSMRRQIVIVPFRATGADASVGYLREGMVELLSTRLGDDSLGRSVDPGAVLTAWHATASKTGGADLSIDDTRHLAKRFDAGRLVTGSVIGTQSHLVVTARLLAVSDGHVDAEATVQGSADSITTLVDRLAARLLAESAGEHERLAVRTTESLPALRAFLIGQAAYRRGNYQAAMGEYERAIGLDSTFGIAAFQLALSADRLNDAEQHDRALAIAWANRTDLIERDLVHLIAFAGPRYPAPSTMAEQLAAWNRAVDVAPDRAEVWYELGYHLYHDGSVVGLDSARWKAGAAFRHALDLDSVDHVGARQMLILSAARSKDTTLLRRYASASLMQTVRDPIVPFVRWRLSIATGDSAALRDVRSRFDRLDDVNLRLIAMASMHDGVGVEDGLRAVRLWSARHPQQPGWLDPFLAQHAFALNQGRPADALAITVAIGELQPHMRTQLRLRVLDAIYGGGDAAAGERAAADLAAVADAPATGDLSRGLQLADLCVLEQWRLAHGSAQTARATIIRLRQAPQPRSMIPVAPNQRACAVMLDAWLAVSTRAANAEQRVVALDSLTLTGPAAGDAANYSNILLARLYDQLGHPDRAYRAIKRRSYMTGWPRYLATSLREHARLAWIARDSAPSHDMYAIYLALRTSQPVTVPVQARRGSFLRRHAAHWGR